MTDQGRIRPSTLAQVVLYIEEDSLSLSLSLTQTAVIGKGPVPTPQDQANTESWGF
jgi:hypothetical protein